MIRRFATGVALATGLALSLTGCLGSAGDKAGEVGENIKLSAAQVLGRTAQKTGQLDSFAADLSMEMTGAREGNVSATGQMRYRLKPDLAYALTFDRMTVDGQSMGGMEQILVNRTIYMKMPMLSRLGVNPSKPWFKMTLDELGRKSGLNVDEVLQQAQQMDPVQNTKMLTASKDAREVGKETVNGVETTHYTGTYRMEDALAQLSPEQREIIRKGYEGSGMENMQFDLWVDDQQLPRKMIMRSQQTAGGALTMTITYRDFGKPVNIAEPPATEVTDLAEMMKGMGGGLPGS